ncbi:MAG: magnesium transporter [Acidobacteria bacterium]|nr:magnesium transporter [Acidobacteriota bacterium]
MHATLGSEHLHEPSFAHLRRDYVPLHVNQTVGDAMVRLRGQQLGDKLVYFYVVDDDGRLRGVVPTRRLLVSEPDTLLADIMITRLITIPTWATVHEASDMFVTHRFLAFPVVDTEGRLHGTADISLFTREIADLADRQTAEDAFQLIGIHLRQNVGPWAGFKDRFPWLLANVSGGLLAALVTSRYESLLDAAVVLALFIPVVLALAESVSIQAVTLTLATLHHSTAALPEPRGIMREVATAAMLGASCGLLVGGVAGAWQRSPLLLGTIAAVITLSMMTASLFGLLLPSVLRALRKDPNIASGPIVLALADIATLLFYFNLAGWLLG